MTIRRITMHQSAQRLAHAIERQGGTSGEISISPQLRADLGLDEPARPRRTRAKKAKRARRR